jgi:DNA-directed RNA polymerase specialized sigma24 family protein
MPEFSQLESAELLARYRAGNEDAAAELFARYVERLTLLARARLSPRLARRVDPEDIVLSAWRSFFVGARDGRLSVGAGGELWPLLVTITLRKLYRNVKHHTAERRTVDAEQSPDVAAAVLEPVCSEPRPEHAAALADELEAILRGLGPFERRVMELCLQGESVAAIAAETGRAERTVRRACSVVRELLVRRLESLGTEQAIGGALLRPQETQQRPGASADQPDQSGAPREPPVRPPRTSRVVRHAEAAPATLAYSDYLLQRQIGAGRMGKVYRALDRRSGGLVAVKFL